MSHRLDKLIRRHTGFTGMDDMLSAGGNYRPSIDASQPAMRRIADAYDAAQEKRGDPRRAYRYRVNYRKPLSWRQRLSYAVNLSPVRVLFNSPDIEMRAMLAQRKVRASVYEENHPHPRAAYTGEQWTARIMGHLTCPIN